MKTFKITFFLILLSTICYSQTIKSSFPDQIDPENLKNLVYLYNKSNIKISYNISLDCKNWQAESLKSLNDVVFYSDIYASIGTGDEQSAYILKKGNSYFIAWDNDEKKYAIMRRKPDDTN
jgi:chloramphenicol O-acetyltransferase